MERTRARVLAVSTLLTGAIAYAAAISPILLDGAASARARAEAEDLRGGPVAERGRPITLAWVGDITPGSRYGVPPDGARPLFRATRETLRAADVAVGNLEGTLSVGGASKCGGDGGDCFSFQAPPEVADGLGDAGFALMSLANNHAFDFGPQGQGQTVRALRERDVAVTGRPGEIAVLRRGGVRIAFVGFAPYRWANDVRDLEAVTSMVRAAGRRADVIVVLAHLGGEGSDQMHVPAGREVAMGEDRGDTRAFAHAAVDAGADLVLASGPHVLRGIERRRGRVIAYSLGNFAGWNNFSRAGDLALSGILTVRVAPDGRVLGGRLTPLRLTGPGIPTPDPTRASVALVDRLGAEDFGADAVRLRADGSF
jgi:hypothetical protein